MSANHVPCRGAGCTRSVHVATPHQMCHDCELVMGWVPTRSASPAVTFADLVPPAHDPVTRPAHYTAGKVESIDAIESALGRDGSVAYCIGNAMKYLNRMGKKDDAVQDARKARWYLDRAIKNLEAA
jgi:hypothetical protein